jgi:hypothetical protein
VPVFHSELIDARSGKITNQMLGGRLGGFRKHGSAGTRESAMVDIERNWQTWLEAAGLVERWRP